jgi:hypothetical protein
MCQMSRIAPRIAGLALVVVLSASCVNPVPIAPQASTHEVPGATSALLLPGEVTLDTQGLPWSWQANLVRATPYTADQPPGPTGLPEHIEINFGVIDPADRMPGDPIMYIIPVDAYRQMWDEAGNPHVTSTIDRIFQWTVALQSPPPTAGLPALPPEEVTGVNDLAVQIARTSPQSGSASRSGYRFVGRWAQDANPVTNQGLRYVYQGFTNDGVYLVAFFYPVTTPQLGPIDALPAEEWDAFNADPQAYIQAQAEALNALAPVEWEPDLTTLDAVVDSLRITGMPDTGLHIGPWQWVSTTTSGVETPVTNPEQYQVTYDPSGTFSYIAGCNSGTGGYIWDGGMVGSVRTDLPAAELPACTDDSASQELYDSLRAAQDYRVRPGGALLQLNMPAGGPVLNFKSESLTTVQ